MVVRSILISMTDEHLTKLKMWKSHTRETWVEFLLGFRLDMIKVVEDNLTTKEKIPIILSEMIMKDVNVLLDNIEVEV